MPSDRSPARLFSNADADQLLRMSREGKSVAVIAETLEFSPGTIYRHLKQDDELREEWQAARKAARQIKGDKAEAVIWEVADDAKHKDRLRAAERLAEAFNDDFKKAERTPEDDRSDAIAEALNRFTATVVSLATRRRAELPAGGTD